MSVYETYRKRIFSLAEPQYRDFVKSLMPNTENVLGVRLPALRKLAKELSKDRWQEYFELNEDCYFEETMLQGMTIGYLKEDIKTIFVEIQKFLPKITNWSLCDSFCAGLKITNKHRDKMWSFIMECLKSDKPYYVRFAVVMMLDYYIDEDHIDDIYIMLNSISNDDYYVKMAVAWAISICYMRFKDKTMQFLKQNSLDNFTHNKAIQKICESLKVSKEEKQLIRSMKC